MRRTWRVGVFVALVAGARLLYRRVRSGQARDPGPEPQAKPSFDDTLTEPAEPRRERDERLRRASAALILAVLLGAILFGLREWAANDRPSFRASFVATKPIADKPISVTGVPSTPPTSKSPPPIIATFGRLTVARLRSGRPGTVLIDIVVDPEECAGLVARLGGKCEGHEAPAKEGGELELDTFGSHEVISADFWFSHPRRLELTEGDLTKARVATAWDLESESRITRVDISCGESTLVISARHTKRFKCAFVGAHYLLPIRSEENVVPTVGLGEVSEFDAFIDGDRVAIPVNEGVLSRDGVQETLTGVRSFRVEMRSSRHHPIEVHALSRLETGESAFAMSAAEADAIGWEERDHTPSLLDRQPELAYALFGVVMGFILVAIVEFIVVAAGSLSTRARKAQ